MGPSTGESRRVIVGAQFPDFASAGGARLPAVSNPVIPDYAGGSLLNLVADLERRLRGVAESPGLRSDLASAIPDGETYVLVVLDGLGAGQLDHEAAEPLRRHLVATIDAPFPTTTTVSLATIATGRPPAQHGLIGYQLWLPELGHVVNTIKWTTLWGEPLDYDTEALLPGPNLWERLRHDGCEPITVQPAGFERSPLSRALYRGCRFEPVVGIDDWIEAVIGLAAEPGRLILAYLPHVDFAAHSYGQGSVQYRTALRAVGDAWDRVVRGLPPTASAVATADHGHIDFPESRRAEIPRRLQDGLILYGDPRVVQVKGDGARLAAELPATWAGIDEIRHWWGHGPAHPAFADRAPDGALVADDGWVLLHRHSDKRLIGNHGGLTDEERLVPLLVPPGP